MKTLSPWQSRRVVTRLIPALVLTGLLFLPGCAAVKLAALAGKATSVSKVAVTTSKVAVATTVAGKAASASKAAPAAVGALAVAEVVTVSDDVWRLGSLAQRAGVTSEQVVFVARAADDTPTAGSKALDVVLNSSDFAGWIDTSEPQDGWEAGEGAPSDVAASLSAAHPGSTALTKARRVDTFWLQFFRTPQGDALVAYDTASKTTQTRLPQPVEVQR